MTEISFSLLERVVRLSEVAKAYVRRRETVRGSLRVFHSLTV